MCSRFNKDGVIVSLHRRLSLKAQRSTHALSDRLERYLDSICLEVFLIRELRFSLVQEVEVDQIVFLYPSEMSLTASAIVFGTGYAGLNVLQISLMQFVAGLLLVLARSMAAATASRS